MYNTQILGNIPGTGHTEGMYRLADSTHGRLVVCSSLNCTGIYTMIVLIGVQSMNVGGMLLVRSMALRTSTTQLAMGDAISSIGLRSHAILGESGIFTLHPGGAFGSQYMTILQFSDICDLSTLTLRLVKCRWHYGLNAQNMYLKLW